MSFKAVCALWVLDTKQIEVYLFWFYLTVTMPKAYVEI